MFAVSVQNGIGWCNVCFRHWIWSYLSITQHHNRNVKPTNPSVVFTLHLTALSGRNLRGLAEHVAAGKDRGCCWRELICSCSWCVTVTASFLRGNPSVTLIFFFSLTSLSFYKKRQTRESDCVRYPVISTHCRWCLHLFIHERWKLYPLYSLLSLIVCEYLTDYFALLYLCHGLSRGMRHPCVKWCCNHFFL